MDNLVFVDTGSDPVDPGTGDGDGEPTGLVLDFEGFPTMVTVPLRWRTQSSLVTVVLAVVW